MAIMMLVMAKIMKMVMMMMVARGRNEYIYCRSP